MDPYAFQRNQKEPLTLENLELLFPAPVNRSADYLIDPVPAGSIPDSTQHRLINSQSHALGWEAWKAQSARAKGSVLAPMELLRLNQDAELVSTWIDQHLEEVCPDHPLFGCPAPPSQNTPFDPSLFLPPQKDLALL